MIVTIGLAALGFFLCHSFPLLMIERADLRANLAGLLDPSPAMVDARRKLAAAGQHWHDYKNLWVTWGRLNQQRAVKLRFFIEGTIMLGWAADRAIRLF